jgi:4-diphosphocytidyl-2-C-methyl-D-erythritol kinase
VSDPLRLRTNAKVNLFLRVMSRRGDGFHQIETAFQSVDLADEVRIVPTESGRVDVEMTLDAGLVGEVPSAVTNLAYRAARRLVHEGAQIEGALIEITKRIPIGAGLGGGSSNAAGVLVGFNEIWALGLEGASLRALAADVGSDVPYCIEGGAVLATGRGERLSKIESRCELWLVLGLSFEPLSAAKIYSRWDEVGSSDDTDGSAMIDALQAGNVEGVASLLRNDLETTVFSVRPELDRKKALLIEAGALGACVTGSGPTLFGVASDAAHAGDVAARVESAFDRVVVVRSTPRCIERL